MKEIERLSVEELLQKDSYEGMVAGIPTGMYADRASYGNAPILVFILNGKLARKVKANPYSHRYKAEEGKVELKEEFELLMDKIINVEFNDENEMLGVAAAYVDQAIRDKTKVEVYGKYENLLFNVQYLRIGKMGFEFPGYQFIFEREDF